MNSVELKIILDFHAKWLKKEPGGKRANLRWADLSEADLSGAILSGANLRVADLSWAILSGADLSGADLSWAILSGADLSGADLSGADLRGADLRGADLRRADLRGADLSEADLSEADLSEAKNITFPISCPEKGSFIGFKKANGLIVELEIPSDALRSSATTRKCRCSKAKVISITNLDGSPSDVTSTPSSWDGNFIYSIGDIVEVADFDTNRWNECAPGIHFFMTRQEAVDY